MENKMKKWLGPKPQKCDLCRGKFVDNHFIDGATIYRSWPWALMCTTCHSHSGHGLGTGRGQLYNLTTLEKLEG